jgi:dienelactone hydrolase
VTLAIGSPGGDARDFKGETGGATCQPLSYLAYVAANCANALANRPEVDTKRIGIVGHSYGGKWAMFASCLYDKFAAAVWSDPGIVFDEPRANVNYWEPWYLGFDPNLPAQRKPGLITRDNPRTGAYKLMIERRMDLVELHALMAPRPFLVSGGSEDTPARWTALNHSIAVNKLLGATNRVAMHNRKAHPPTAESNDVIYAFFEHFLKP